VITGASLRLSPYAFSYLDVLKNQGADVNVFVWNRDGQRDLNPDEKISVNEFTVLLDDAVQKRVKIIPFIRYRRAIKRELSKNKYDFIVVLTTQIAILLSDILIRKYSGRFIYDMRDPSYESYWFFRKRVAKIVGAAAGVFISSDGYREYLPNSKKIYTTHNIQIADLERSSYRSSNSHNIQIPLRISFWGYIRDCILNQQLIKVLGNDRRFVLQYFGKMNNVSKSLADYCKENKITNVNFLGEYRQEERHKFSSRTDLLHNIYSNSFVGGNPRMTNKFYDGIIFNIPQICSKGSYMEEIVLKNNIGLSVDIDDNLGDLLWNYYFSIDWKDFQNKCNALVEKVKNEYDRSNEVLNQIVVNSLVQNDFRKKVDSGER
jgi:hypothetical protein